MSYTSPESTSRSRDLSNVSESLYGRQGSSHLGAIPVPLPLDFTPRDLPELQRLHAQMTVDNLRLWECLNIIRCNRRVNGIDVLYDVFSMTDKEFFLNYPAYAGYDESGSGALRNVETSGGNHSERYLQHLVMHNNRLILENGRLYVCIEMLSSDPSMIPDEVVCHIFALNEEEFIRRYPSIEPAALEFQTPKSSEAKYLHIWTRANFNLLGQRPAAPFLPKSCEIASSAASAAPTHPFPWCSKPSQVQQRRGSDDEYLDDGGHFDDYVGESDDYDDGVAYKRKNGSVLSSRDKDTASGQKCKVSVKSPEEREDSSKTLDVSQTRCHSPAAPNKSLTRKDLSLHANSCRKDPSMSENLSVSLSAKRGNSPTSPRSRGDNISSRNPRLRSSWSAGHTVESRKSMPMTRNDRSCSPRCKVLEGETRGRSGSLQRPKKPFNSTTTTRTSLVDKTRHGFFKPLVVRHDFSPPTAN
ncbi:hypothetical protein C0Q70_05893 [Pomacea canaliculata]|uniref:Uncharacterized protein n=1 Tax=Pomacea canaliculata TaxID=400727 RepID=A0A2T7PML1_POMCA|nr:hypothetical protein C0Q70_05893 [Pomacea canaliculata]